MSRAEDTHATNLKNIFNTIEDAGYSAIMLVYDPLHADYLIKTAHVLNKNHNLKYIFAMRAYAISPEYCAMITNAYDEIVPGKLIFNIAAGDEFQMKNNEVGLDGVVDGEILLNNNDKRIEHVSKFLEKFKKLPTIKKMPELIISGKSDKTLENVVKYGDSTLCMYYDFLKEPEKFMVVKKRIAVASCLIREKNELEDSIKKLKEFQADSFTLYGTKNEVKEKILELYKSGATHVMLTKHHFDEKSYLIHEMVKEFILENKNNEKNN